MDDDFGKGRSLSTENEQNNETSHMENEIYDLTTMVEDLDAMVEAEIYDLTTMVEDLDAMVEAEINEECTEINNEGKNIENDDIRGSIIGITRETSEMMYELYCQHAHEIGFSVRKSSTRYSCKDHIELSKMFVCSCSG
ncbi:hypothetical protein ACS0TY_003221 [Phlomoides rotata]